VIVVVPKAAVNVQELTAFLLLPLLLLLLLPPPPPPPKGFYFAILSTVPIPVTLTDMKVTSNDLKTMVVVEDMDLPAATITAP